MKCNNSKFNYLNGCYIQGPTGPKGEPGVKVEIGSTTTGLPGSDAMVTNSGTEENVILDFVIPAGKTGESPILEIGTVKTGNPGTQASVKITPIKGEEKRDNHE